MCAQDQGLLGGYDGLPVGKCPDCHGTTCSGADFQPAGADPSVSVNMVSQFLDAHPEWGQGAYEVSRNMYEPSHWDIPADFQGGLFSGTNPILAGEAAPFGFMRVPPNELGVHRIGLVISREAGNSFGNLSVLKLPLYSKDELYGKSLVDGSITSKDVQDWVPGLLGSIRADHVVNQQLESVQLLDNVTGYSCPLMRHAFYSGINPKFAPSVPSPLRAR